MSDDLGVYLSEGRAVVDSPDLARRMRAEHDLLLVAVRRLPVSEAFHRRHFQPAEAADGQPIYRVSRDGFALLAGQLRQPGGVRLVEAYLEAMSGLEAAARLNQWPGAAPEARIGQTAGSALVQAHGSAPVITQPPGAAPASGPLPVPFRGATLYVVDLDGEPYVPMRPVVEGMGLAWKPQYLKLVEDKQRFCVTEMVTQMPGDDQNRQVVCLPLRKVSGWLMTISPNKVRPELRDRILAYQNECDEVLWRYWSGQTVSRPAPARDAPKAGAYVLDDAFTARLYVALGRKAVQTEVVRRLLTMGGAEAWQEVSVRKLAFIRPRLSSSATHKAMLYLVARGVVQRDGEGRYRVDAGVLDQLMASVRDLPARLDAALAGNPWFDEGRLISHQGIVDSNKLH